MNSIEKRCEQRGTHAFVTKDTIDPLGRKLIDIVGDRRMTKMRRYLGENGGAQYMWPGLRVWRGGLGEPVTIRKGQSVSIATANQAQQFESVGFSVNDDASESRARMRYNQPETEFLGQRRDITYVQLDGWPGSPQRDDSIRIEHWNSNGVGHEVVVIFDDVNPVQELAWDVKGDRERYIRWDDEVCTTHSAHIEDPGHLYRPGECVLRDATLAENLRALANLAEATE